MSRVAVSVVSIVALAVAACSSPAVKKRGGSTGAQAAKSASQKTGSRATGGKSQGTSKGSSEDGVACDATTAGVGFCADDATLVFCDGETWWSLSCPALVESSFCGYDEAAQTVDCYAP
jgi:hypothetical protein